MSVVAEETGNRDSKTWNGTEPYEVLFGQAWQGTARQQIAFSISTFIEIERAITRHKNRFSSDRAPDPQEEI